MAWFIPLLVALAFTAIAYALTPKPRSASRPPAFQDLKEPTIEDVPIQWSFGTNLHKDPNVLWYGEPHVREHWTSD